MQILLTLLQSKASHDVSDLSFPFAEEKGHQLEKKTL